MSNRATLEADFERDLRAILDGERELGYNSSRFRQMLDERGGVGTAHALLKTNPPDGTFTELKERGRLDLTMEFYVVKPKYRELFEPQELEAAQWRLDNGG
jgi:hypothetical protein